MSSSSSSIEYLVCDEFSCISGCNPAFDNVIFNGATNHNTDNGKLYIRFTGSTFLAPPPFSPWYQLVEVFKDAARTMLVAKFEDGPISPFLTVSLTEENASGLNGSLDLWGLIISIDATVECNNYSSSSSSIEYSSSSSSIDSSSSSSEGYSSSSSFGLTSSSSSSMLDYHGDKLIPFTIECSVQNIVWDMAFYRDYAYIGNGQGEILRSINRSHWGLYYKTADVNVTALYVDNDYLYAGTSPNGGAYRFKMSDDSVTLYGDFANKVVDFARYGDELMMALESGDIYVYDSANDQWDYKYKAYAPIQEMDIINGRLYVAVKGENIISYDGLNWMKVDLGNNTTISSIRNVTGDFSFIDFSSLNRSDTITPVDEAIIYETYPQNKSIGISCIEQDGTSIIMGSYNKARIYSLLDNKMKLLFDTNSTNVYDLLNIDVGVDLAAIDNKLYLIYCGSLDKSNASATVTTTDSEQVESNEGKSVVITYPNGGEQFEVGQEVVIQWSSTKNKNDAIKLELLSGDTVAAVIVSQTTNDGSFAWDIPLALIDGDYKIRIQWLSSGSAVLPENEDSSDKTFSISLVTTTTTTNTTTADNPQRPDTSICRGIPILVLPENDHIIKMTKDSSLNSVLLMISDGRILECNESVINGYLTGDRTIFADVRNGVAISNTASTNFTYALYNKIVEVNEDKEIVKWKYVRKAASIPVESVTGTFLSPVLFVQEDFGFWKQLIWNETKLPNTEITISLKAANTSEELLFKDWQYGFRSDGIESNPITRELNNIELKGKYIQIKVEMKSMTNISPSVANVTVVYTTKQASYFYTTRFSLENGADINKGLVIAEITEPVNTEVQIGICGVESSNWNDYTIVTPEKFFELDNIDSVKVGMRFVTYDDVNVPSASDFGMIFSGSKVNTVGV